MKQLTDDLINSVLKDAQNSDLESLIENDAKLFELIADSQISKNLADKRKQLADYNNDQAAHNMTLKPEFELLRSTLSELAQRQNELRDRYMTLQNQMGSSPGSSPDTILSLLQVAAGEQETLSEDFKMSFYDGDQTVDEFIKNFVEGRKLYQIRKVKSEKLKSILQKPPVHQRGVAGGGGGYGQGSVPNRPAPPVPGSLRGQTTGGYPGGYPGGGGGHQPMPYMGMGAQYPQYPR